MNKTKKQPSNKAKNSVDERAQEYLSLFARESPHVRDKIVKDISAYNKMLSLKAMSFEELAVQQYLKEHNQTYIDKKDVALDCFFCGAKGSARKRKPTIYLCDKCGETFTANYNSISSNTKCDALTWMKVLQCLLSLQGQTRTCEFCNINAETYFHIRSKLFHAMQILLEDVKLYGRIEVDNTFVRANYKGEDLDTIEFPEDSIFYHSSPAPRGPRKRGGPYSNAEKNKNSICVFTAIDEYGHVMVRYVGIGQASQKSLKTFVPSNKFMHSVPLVDPFKELFKRKPTDKNSAPGTLTYVLADKEGAIAAYFRNIAVDFKSAVYRQKGVQLRLSDPSINIQRVNALHKRFKEFLHRAHDVSSKYLPGYIILFEFLENTKASDAAVAKLFEILATPNLGMSSAFYDNMFTVPRYLTEWFDDDNPLSNFPYNKLLAFYLYDQIRNPDEYNENEKITHISEVEDIAGYSASTIRKNYKTLCAAGYRELIIRHLSGNSKKTIVQDKPKAEQLFSPVVLAVFDEWAKVKALPQNIRPSLENFLKEKSQQYGTTFKRTTIIETFKRIVKSGVRESLPDFNRAGIVSERMITIANDYKKLVMWYKERGEKVPSKTSLLQVLADTHNLSWYTVEQYVNRVQTYKHKQKRTNGDFEE